MLNKDNKKQIKSISLHSVVLCFIVLIGIYSASYVLGQVMSGASYRIQSDSVNFGGGFSTSTTFLIQDTGGEVATGDSSSANFKMRAGYQNMRENILSLSTVSDVIMSPSIGGVTGGTSNGSSSFTVITDSPAGYTVSIQASNSPAMRSDLDTIADYTSAGADPDFNFSIPSSASAFAFTVEGVDSDQKFKDDGSACNTGAGNTADKCWVGLSTSPQIIVSRTSANQPSGTLTTLKFQAQSGSAHVQVEGTYVATTTITALSL